MIVNVIRTLLFVVFFSIGAAAMGGSVLCDDLVRYYRNRHFLAQAERLTARLESLNADYDALLHELEEDPNLVQRIAPVAIGADQNEPNTVHPRATVRELASARKALEQMAKKEPNEPVMPRWLVRSSQPRHRLALFLCGAALIVISLVCFAPRKAAEADQEQ